MEHSPEENEVEKIERLKRAMYSRSIAPNIKDKPRRVLELDRAVVGEDWQRPEPEMAVATVAPFGIGLMRSALKWILGLSIVFFIGAGGFFLYYFTLGGGGGSVSPGHIDISVAGPLQVTSGEPAELQIAVVNRNRGALELADLVVRYPPGTRSPTDLVTDLPVQRIPLGEIEPGGRRQGTVSAVFSGVEGTHATIVIELEYRLGGSSAIFVASSQYEFVFASSPLTISVEANRETISGQPLEFTVTVSSAAAAPIRDILLTADFPFGFTLTNATPAASSGGNTWHLGDLAPGGQRSVTLQGTLSGESGDERVFRFSAGTRRDATEQSITTTLADYAHPVAVSRPFLDLGILVNRDSGTGVTVGPGETVNVAVTYRNNLTTPVADAVIVARLSGIDIDGSSVRTTDGFYRSSDNAMLWDKTTTNGELEMLAPGAAGSVNFSFQMPPSEVMKAFRDPRLEITVHAAGRRVSQSGVPESLQSTARHTIRVASDLQLIAQGLYYANPFGSTGPMPPTAGRETTYAIVFSLTNTTNRVTNGVVQATLPPYVRWIGIYSPSSEELIFNQNDSTVTWRVGTIEPGVGLNGTLPRQAAIAIGFNPSTSQIGQQPPLIRAISFTGVDEGGGLIVTRTVPDVTTNIVGDPGFSAANATVVREEAPAPAPEPAQ